MTLLPKAARRPHTLLLDAGLAVGLAFATVVAIQVQPQQGTDPDVLAYCLVLMIAALVMLRRRWPVAVLLASAAILQIYNMLDYPGLFPAVPLSVALATAWAADHRVWALLLTAWFVAGPVGYATYQAATGAQPVLPLLDGILRDMAMFAAVLSLGEVVRSRRELDQAHRLLAAEQQRSEQLLLNVLPVPIAARLKTGENVIADQFSDVTVLFADLVDFTRGSERASPDAVVEVLNELFTAFDELAQRHGLEKIKTVGDAYMVAGGLPEPRPDHAEAVADLALAMRDEAAHHLDASGRPLQLRIGIDTGPVVAGVIGRQKFSYDLWGDTVNTASRMESHGIAGHIQVTDRTYRRLRGRYRLEARGLTQVKSKGSMTTYFLVGRAG
jgi:class 3 adenylate cyclase